jgi:hypothetical protein
VRTRGGEKSGQITGDGGVADGAPAELGDPVIEFGAGDLDGKGRLIGVDHDDAAARPNDAEQFAHHRIDGGHTASAGSSDRSTSE